MVALGWGMATGWHILTIAGLVTSLVGCVGTSVPQPPNLQPVDVDLVDWTTQEATGPRLFGEAGAAPPGAEVWLWDLESAEPPVVVLAAADGSFGAPLPAMLGEVRLQVRVGRDRSIPVDAQVTETVEPSRRPACVGVPLEIDLGEARAAAFLLEHDCVSESQLDRVELRMSNPSLTVNATAPALLPSGARLEVSVSAAGIATEEDIVFVYVTVDGVPVRYPVSVIARAP